MSTRSRSRPQSSSTNRRSTSVISSVIADGPRFPAGLGDDIDDDSLNEVIMAVDVRTRGTVGCSYYVPREEKLYFMEDVKFGGADVVETREYLSRCNPTANHC